MLKEVMIKCSDIKKIKDFEDNGAVHTIVVYTEKDYYVCVPSQKKPTENDVFITLHLKPSLNKKDKCD